MSSKKKIDRSETKRVKGDTAETLTMLQLFNKYDYDNFYIDIQNDIVAINQKGDILDVQSKGHSKFNQSQVFDVLVKSRENDAMYYNKTFKYVLAYESMSFLQNDDFPLITRFDNIERNSTSTTRGIGKLRHDFNNKGIDTSNFHIIKISELKTLMDEIMKINYINFTIEEIGNESFKYILKEVAYRKSISYNTYDSFDEILKNNKEKMISSMDIRLILMQNSLGYDLVDKASSKLIIPYGYETILGWTRQEVYSINKELYYEIFQLLSDKNNYISMNKFFFEILKLIPNELCHNSFQLIIKNQNIINTSKIICISENMIKLFVIMIYEFKKGNKCI